MWIQFLSPIVVAEYHSSKLDLVSGDIIGVCEEVEDGFIFAGYPIIDKRYADHLINSFADQFRVIDAPDGEKEIPKPKNDMLS